MSSPGRSQPAEQTLLVGNLESRVREEILYELFLQAGPLTKVMICEDKEGKPKSFGYVCFKHKVSVPYAKALLDRICLYGRPITVQYWRGSSHSPELDICTDGFEHHIDLGSPVDRHQELSGNSPFPVTPLPVNNCLLHDHPGFQEANQTAQFKTAQSSPEQVTVKCPKRDERKRKRQSCDNDTSTEDSKRKQRQHGQNYGGKKRYINTG